MPARWGFEGSIAQERYAIRNDPAWLVDLHQPTLSSPPDFIQSGHFQCAVAQIESDSLAGAWGFSNWNVTGLPLGVQLIGMRRDEGRLLATASWLAKHVKGKA